MGSLGDAQDYGTTTNNLQTMGDFGGTWGVHTLNDLPTAICSGSTYVHTIGTGSQFISTYDSRN